MEKVKLTDICNPKQWKTIPVGELLSEGYPVYGANGVIGYYNEYNHETPVVTITCRGATCGTINITSPRSYVTGNAMCLDDLKRDIDREYLYYALKQYDFHGVISGSAQPQITRQGLEKVAITVCPIEKQQEIVQVLRKAKSVIKLREKELKQLDNLIKARFVEMFGDVKTNIYNWEKCTFRDVAKKITDGEHGTVPRVDCGSGYLYFMARNITKDGVIDLSETSYVPREVHDKIYKRCNPESGDLLLVCVGATIGKCTLVPSEMKEFSMARSVALIKPNYKKVNSQFLISLLRSDAIQRDIDNCSHAAAQAGLYTNMIANLDAFVPPLDLQTQFAEFVELVDKSKAVVYKALDSARLMFDSLSQRFFG